MNLSRQNVLTFAILAGLVLGLIVGEVIFRVYWDPAAQTSEVPPLLLEVLKFVGDTFFIGLLKMILVPLVMASVIVGVATLDPGQLGRVGGMTVLYYVGTMLLAVIIGVTAVSLVRPGDPNRDGSGLGSQVIEQGVAAYEQESETTRQHVEEKAEAGRQGVGGALWASFKNITTQIIPDNPVGAMARGEMLPVIAFSLILGIVLAVIGEAGGPVLAFFQSLFAAVMKLVDWILWLAPLGVFCLVAWSVARIGSAALLGPLGAYMGTVALGLLVHGLVMLPLILWLFTQANPFKFMHQMRDALMTAFGSDSSSATLPVTMESAETYGGVSKRSAGFVLPLGATMNMDGTALYEAVAVVFLFQCFGIELTMTQLLIVVITATLAAIGAAGIPSAGLVTMVIVIEAVNQSLGPSVATLPVAAVGIILGVDRILDMCRTTVNVWGDSVGAKIITRIAPDEPAAG